MQYLNDLRWTAPTEWLESPARMAIHKQTQARLRALRKTPSTSSLKPDKQMSEASRLLRQTRRDLQAWSLDPLTLRKEINYFDWTDSSVDAVRHMAERFLDTLKLRSAQRLQTQLQHVSMIVERELDIMTWNVVEHRHNFGPAATSSLMMGINGADQPATVLLRCMGQLVLFRHDVCNQFYAALGLWCLGEWKSAMNRQDAVAVSKALSQASLLLSRITWKHGVDSARKADRSALSSRNQNAADKRHQANQARRLKAQQWYELEGRSLRTKAAAALHISQTYSVTYDTAKRWVRSFSRPQEEGTVHCTVPPVQRKRTLPLLN